MGERGQFKRNTTSKEISQIVLQSFKVKYLLVYIKPTIVNTGWKLFSYLLQSCKIENYLQEHQMPKSEMKLSGNPVKTPHNVMFMLGRELPNIAIIGIIVFRRWCYK